MTSTPTSTAGTGVLPISAGTYTVDKNHSGVHFQIRHLGLSNVRGIFKTFDATLVVGDALDDVSVNAAIDMASVDTNQPDRDAHLRSTDFFHADEHPQMLFQSTAVRDRGDGEYELSGDLTINGITRPVNLAVTFNGSETFPGDGKVHVGFTATTEVRRKDWGVDFNMPIGVDKLALGEKVKVELDLQLVAP
jgi:polyisoprenoid-binding protein YceI